MPPTGDRRNPRLLDRLVNLASHAPMNLWRRGVQTDARRIATSLSTNAAKLWDARSGQEIVSIKGGLGSAISDGSCWVAFTKDSRSFLTASLDENGSRLFVRRRSAVDGKLMKNVEIVQPGGTRPYAYPRLFAADGTRLALVGRKDKNRLVPEPDMGSVSVREGVVAAYDTSQLLNDEASPESPVKN
jgi:hypothetical protein